MKIPCSMFGVCMLGKVVRELVGNHNNTNAVERYEQSFIVAGREVLKP